jgi:hypothetical protein
MTKPLQDGMPEHRPAHPVLNRVCEIEFTADFVVSKTLPQSVRYRCPSPEHEEWANIVPSNDCDVKECLVGHSAGMMVAMAGGLPNGSRHWSTACIQEQVLKREISYTHWLQHKFAKNTRIQISIILGTIRIMIYKAITKGTKVTDVR